MDIRPDKNRRILIIDDQDAIRHDYDQILGVVESAPHLNLLEEELFGDTRGGRPGATFQPETFELSFAQQGQQGLELVKHARLQGQPFALAFVDMRMPPGWDGIETILHIWREDPDIETVICTAYSDYLWQDIIVKLGRTDQLLLLKKPFDVAEVYQLACALTSKWDMRQRASLHMQDLERLVHQQTEVVTRSHHQTMRWQKQLQDEQIKSEKTKRIQVEDELLETQATYQTLVENAHDAIVVLQDGKVVYRNPAYVRLLDDTATEANDREFLDVVVPEDRHQVQDQYRRRLQGEDLPESFEVRLLGRGQRQIAMEAKPCLIPYQGQWAILVVMHDITERKRTEHILEAQIIRLQTLARLNRLISSSLYSETVLEEIANAATQLIHSAQVATFWMASDATQALSEQMDAGHISRQALSFAPSVMGWVTSHERPLNVPDVFKDERFTNLDWWRQQGLKSFLGVPILHQQELIAVLALGGHQAFDFRPAEQELLDSFVAQAAVAIHNVALFAEVTAARDAAEAANQAKSEFLANMSHELRTPLHSVLSYASLGLMRVAASPREKLCKYFASIDNSGHVLLSLLNDLLDLAKLEAGQMRFEFQPCDIHHLLTAVTEEFHSLLAERELRLQYDPGPQTIKALIEPQRLSQVMRNLLSNAVKFSPPGGQITIRKYQTAMNLGIQVRDQGPGIPEGELETVFDKFVQSSKTKTGAGGTGLGLAICQEIIAAHHGRIWAENASDSGAVFTFEIPLNTV